MPVQIVPTPHAPGAAGPYSPAVRAGDWLVLAGQLGLDPGSGALVSDEVGAQTAQALANVSAVLGDCGASLAEVAKATVFLVDMGDFALMNAAYTEAFAGHKPARTTIGVAALPLGGRVEIEVWAHHPLRA
ncbi:MAG: Rid family detoxifying hydrolase [Acidimicrobiia bacterium]